MGYVIKTETYSALPELACVQYDCQKKLYHLSQRERLTARSVFQQLIIVVHHHLHNQQSMQ